MSDTHFSRRTFLMSTLLSPAGLWFFTFAKTPSAQAEDATPPTSTSNSNPDMSANRKRWESLTPEQKERVREAYKKFKALPPERQQKVRQNYQRWRSFSPERRQRIRRNIQRWRSMSPERRARVRERLQRNRQQRRRNR